VSRSPIVSVGLAGPRYWPTWIGLGVLRVLSWLPLPLAAAIGAGLGMVLYCFHGPRRRVVRINIERCFPQLPRAQQRRIVRRHFRAFGQSVMNIPVAWWASPRRLRRVVRLRGRRRVDEALVAGRNVILLAPHFLGLEIGGVRLSLDSALVSVFRHPDNKLVRAVMRRARSRFGLRLIEHNRLFTSLVRAVKAGAPLYYLPDQDAGNRHSVFAPFFGIPAATFTALARLARLTDALVIPCITYQRPWGRGYEMVFHAALADFPSGDALADTARMNAEIERAVRVHPEQYFWLHKRFKTRPPGEPKFY
jgi:Kdo2-lipid IVA lauroyltransferase/acyltransferase